MQFDESIVKVSSQNPVLQPLIPVRYQVCFTVALDKTNNMEEAW